MEDINIRMIYDLKNDWDHILLDNYEISLQLKGLLENGLPLEEFAIWLDYTLDLLRRFEIRFFDYLNHLNIIKNDDKYSTLFFKYCFKLSKCKKYLGTSKLPSEAENILNENVLGPICFVTPELGRWSTVGGLGVMVDELSKGLALIGQDVYVISPYYERNRDGQSDYLYKDEIRFSYYKNITVNLDQSVTFGVHIGTNREGVKYYFLRNNTIFPKAYPEGTVGDTIRRVALVGKASLELLCNLGVIPAIIITNDWYTGLTAAYSKNGCFGETFKGTTFFHICHNLEPTYEGRLYPSESEGTCEGIYQLPVEWLIDPSWEQKIINPSRCAIMMSDQWGTVSNSYKNDLLSTSPLKDILRQKPQPFGFPNGIIRKDRIQKLKEICGTDKNPIKAYIQKTYFRYEGPDFNIPVFSFVGRITAQKGVMLILEAVEGLINKTGGKINILIGGMGDQSDPYVKMCIEKINYLKEKYPY